MAPAHASPSSGEGAGSGKGQQDSGNGNPEVQDALADILDMEIRKSKVKQDIMDDLEVRKERLRQIGQELTDDFGKEIELDKMRMDLASNVAMAETMDKFQQLEDEVQAVRDQLKADKRDLAVWEEQANAARNKNLFFKKLHKSENSDANPDEKKEISEAARQAVANVTEPARKEVNSPWRLYLFVYLATVSGVVVVEDLLSSQPSYALDVLYAAIAVFMAYNVWGERHVLSDK